MPNDVAERVMRVIAETQRMPPEKVTEQSSFEELGIDSLDGINILFALENEFGINIPDEAARGLRTVREMIDGVARLVQSTESQAEAGA